MERPGAIGNPLGVDPTDFLASEPEGDESLQLQHQRLRLEARLFDRRESVRVGRYELGDRLGEGTAGTIYMCHDADLGRHVALQVLHRPEAETADSRAMLVRQAEAVARRARGHGLAVHEIGVANRQSYIAMDLLPPELLDGTSPPTTPPGPSPGARRAFGVLAIVVAILTGYGLGTIDRPDATAVVIADTDPQVSSGTTGRGLETRPVAASMSTRRCVCSW